MKLRERADRTDDEGIKKSELGIMKPQPDGESKKSELGIMKSCEQVISSPEAEHWRLRLMMATKMAVNSLRCWNSGLQLLPAKGTLRGPPSQSEPFRPGEPASFSLGFGFRAYLV